MQPQLEHKAMLHMSTGQSFLNATWWWWICNNMGSHLQGVIVCIALFGLITGIESVAIPSIRTHCSLTVINLSAHQDKPLLDVFNAAHEEYDLFDMYNISLLLLLTV